MIRLLLILFLSPLAAQDSPGTSEGRSLVTADKKRVALMRLQTRQSLVESLISQKKVEFQEAGADFERAKIAEEITALQDELDQLEEEFSEVSTGIAVAELEQPASGKLALSAEIRELLEPLLQELRDVTAAPREAAELRGEINTLLKKLQIIERAEEALDRLGSGDLSNELEASVAEERDKLSKLRQSLETKLSVAEFELAQREENSPPVVESLSSMIQGFFRSRGVHLLIAVVAAFVVVLLMRKSYQKVMRYCPRSITRRETLTARMIYLSYSILITLGGVFAFLLSLYLANDWVLLSIALLFLLGVAWAGKNALPQFFEQAKLMLNLGTVRNGERLVYEGIPWEVQRINFYTDLKNPALDGGLIRLPIDVLQELHSRPNGERELWFPCQEGEWIKLSDGTFGKVIQQTPDYVNLVKLGGARKVIPTADFLGLHPENLSHNFRVVVTFGIDYAHQEIATNKVPLLFETAIQRALLEKMEKEQLLSLKVFFTSAASSSLDYRVVADFSGDLAPRMRSLQDLITSACVDACNVNGWGIPFTQVTIHQADKPALELVEDDSGALTQSTNS